MPEDTIPLNRFFEAVEERLSACSADVPRSILLAMAQVGVPATGDGWRKPDPPLKRLSAREERAALWAALGLPPHARR